MVLRLIWAGIHLPQMIDPLAMGTRDDEVGGARLARHVVGGLRQRAAPFGRFGPRLEHLPEFLLGVADFSLQRGAVLFEKLRGGFALGVIQRLDVAGGNADQP
jgi:hypothetical protein